MKNSSYFYLFLTLFSHPFGAILSIVSHCSIQKKQVPFGITVAVCGNAAELGSWNPAKSTALRWSEGAYSVVLLDAYLICFFAARPFVERLCGNC